MGVAPGARLAARSGRSWALERTDRRPLLAHSHLGDLAVEALRSPRTSRYFAMLDADNRVVWRGLPVSRSHFVQETLDALWDTPVPVLLVPECWNSRASAVRCAGSIPQVGADRC
ncbi:MAG: hypothetical protein IT469_12860 [Pseudomonadales bacterium]|nr:hypothetical protein [Pseudomonadales bacterium]